MPIVRGDEALTQLRNLLHSERSSLSDLEAKTPASLVEPASWPEQHGPLVESSYRLSDENGEELRFGVKIHVTPHDLIDSTRGEFDQEQLQYCSRSVDVTMRGGTTSGVVYPLAVCAIAQRFRLRNIGGASAGAIAASSAAAAELGRLRMATAAAAAADASTDPTVDAAAAAPGPLDSPAVGGTAGAVPPTSPSGTLRAGFVGMADVIGWLTQTDAPDPASASAGAHRRARSGRTKVVDERRISQLFQPTDAGRPMFRVVAACMRGRWYAAALLLLLSFGMTFALINLVLILAAPVVALDDAVWSGSWWRGVTLYLLSLLWFAAVTVTVGGLLGVGINTWRRALQARRSTAEARLAPQEPLADVQESTPIPATAMVVTVGAVAVLVGIELVVTRVLEPAQPLLVFRVFWAWLSLVIGLLIVAVVGLVVFTSHLKDLGYGLVSGATPVGGAPRLPRLARLLDAVAGMPRPTVEDSLIPWLNHSLNALAAQPDGEVLRFGHLWLPDCYQPGAKGIEDRINQAWSNTRARSINLEVMATELVHGVPLKFPLGPDVTWDLLIRRRDIDGPDHQVFPPDVVAILSAPASKRDGFYDITSGELIEDLYELPRPVDLPVLVATRFSLALPCVFQAIRVYRRTKITENERRVRDDLGQVMQQQTGTGAVGLQYPDMPDKNWVEELWISDGGITSNFPIHFFDFALPLWPTLGVSLGPHPQGQHHQDVWLPSEAEVRVPPSEPAHPGLRAFLWSMVTTARSWHDTTQSFLPAFRGRVAWVRQWSSEGSVNLFMGRDVVASLALRGHVAGTRLRDRFGDPLLWQRQQWLRLRIALQSLSHLQQRIGIAGRHPAYASTADIARLADHQSLFATRFPDLAHDIQADGGWYVPEEPRDQVLLASDAAALIRSVGGALLPAPTCYEDDVPVPAAHLRQVPPL